MVNSIIPLSDILNKLHGVKKSGEGYVALCPSHKDKEPSLSISEGEGGKVLVKCHAGCSIEDVVAAMGLEVKDLFPAKGSSSPSKSNRQIVTEHDYHDEKGRLLFQVCRTMPKGFFQRQPDGNGNWKNGLKGIKPVPYRLPQVRQAIAESKTIFMPEGEKDVDNLEALGLAATCNPMGAGKWRDYYGDHMKGAKVVILPDNDTAGKKHAVDVAKSLHGKAASVKILELQGLPEKGDVSDWLKNDGTAEDLKNLALEAPEWEPPQTGNGEASSPWPYSIIEGCICMEKGTRAGPITVPLSNFSAKIIEEELRDDGAEQRLTFTLEGTLTDGSPLAGTTVPASRFPALNWPTEAWGNRAVVFAGMGTKDNLRCAIQILSGDVPRRTVFEHIGWRKINGHHVYLHSGGGIGAYGFLEDVHVELDGKLKNCVLPGPPIGDELKEAVMASLDLLELAPKEITIPLLAATYRAPLGEMAVNDFSQHLSGPTGCQKTELTALAQAHYGPTFNSRKLPGNWSSTGNALERQSFLLKDAIFTVDDFAPTGTSSDVARLHRDADRLLRGAGNQAGRGRLKSDTGQRPEYYPRGVVLSSGEDIPRGQSLRARLFVVEVSRGDVDLKKLTQAQDNAAKGLFAQAMAGYIHWLAPQIDTLKKTLPEQQRELRTRARADGVQHDRTPDVQASLALGFEVFLKFAQDVGVITAAQYDRKWHDAWNALTTAAKAQASFQAAEEPTGRFLALLAAAIASGQAHVADAETGEEPNNPENWGWRKKTIGSSQYERSEWFPQGDRIGWIAGDALMLEPESTYRAVKRFANDQGENLAITQRTLWKRMAEKRLLASVAPGKNVAYQTVLGKRRYVIHLHVSVLSRIPGTIGSPGTDPDNNGVDVPEKCARNTTAPEFQARKIGTPAPITWDSDPSVPEVPETIDKTLSIRETEIFNRKSGGL